VPVDWISLEEALDTIAAGARNRSFLQVSTVNLDFLTNARRDPETRTILHQTSLNLADGVPIVWLGRLQGARPPGKVAGSDLVPLLMEKAADEGLGVFLLGGENGVAQAAADRLTSTHPGPRVSVYEPLRAGLDDLDDDEIFRHLDESQPEILLVAFGHPKQEKWIHRHRDRLPMACIGVGCCFDLIAGQRDRAPRWMQTTGLEWAFRLWHEPARLTRRYLVDGLWLVCRFFPESYYLRLRRNRRTLGRDDTGGPALRPLVEERVDTERGEHDQRRQDRNRVPAEGQQERQQKVQVEDW
jgi:N-acetylglucosaminyldiphosphoundecaprenol N-acetyl-beta-D-mannosaminyltransferase